jgi:ACT domain-containing protein
LELCSELGNISEACRKLGVSRQHYYDIKQVIVEEGLEGLHRRLPGMQQVAERPQRP